MSDSEKELILIHCWYPFEKGNAFGLIQSDHRVFVVGKISAGDRFSPGARLTARLRVGAGVVISAG